MVGGCILDIVLSMLYVISFGHVRSGPAVGRETHEGRMEHGSKATKMMGITSCVWGITREECECCVL